MSPELNLLVENRGTISAKKKKKKKAARLFQQARSSGFQDSAIWLDPISTSTMDANRLKSNENACDYFLLLLP